MTRWMLEGSSANHAIDNLGELAAGLGKGVEVVLARAARLDQPAVAEQCQVMAHGGLALGAEVGSTARRRCAPSHSEA